MLVIQTNYTPDKITKVRGTSKAKRMVQNRQKLDAIENQIVFRIDRADKQRESRREKRKPAPSGL